MPDTIPASIQSEIDKLAPHLAEQAVVQQKLAEARRAQEDNAQSIAFEDLSDAEVANSLHGIPVPDRLVKKVEVIQREKVRSEALITGLEKHDAELTQVIAHKRVDIETALNAWLRQENDANRLELETALNEFESRLRPILARARGLGDDRILNWARSVELPTPGTGRNLLRNLTDWRTDERMSEIVLAHTNVRAHVEMLLKED